MPRSGSTYNFGLCIFSNDVIVYRVNLQTKTNILRHIKMSSGIKNFHLIKATREFSSTVINKTTDTAYQSIKRLEGKNGKKKKKLMLTVKNNE